LRFFNGAWGLGAVLSIRFKFSSSGFFISGLYGMAIHNDINHPALVRQREKMHRKMKAEMALMNIAVAETNYAWARIEDGMLLILKEALGDNEGKITSAIYFTPSNLETRFQLVRNTLHEARKDWWFGDRFKFEQEWDAMILKLNRLKQTRNKIAHSGVQSWQKSRQNRATCTIGHVRLAPSFYNWQEFDRTTGKQMPGMSVNDVVTHVEAAKKLGSHILLLKDIVRLYKASTSFPNEELQQALDALEADRLGPGHPQAVHAARMRQLFRRSAHP
jgi:hypothetical protein